ncbi:hypothetical protein M3Y99_00346700 [Aphelenchoides fujianensis]|nr:hypothetical protein M3Y99_00346700 [Aphelenchoides fujianensis]
MNTNGAQSSSSTNSEAASLSEQSRPLLHRVAERARSPLSRRFRMESQYSMGGDVDAEAPAKSARELNDRCCCGLISLRMGALVIAGLEFLFLLYNFGIALWNYNKSGDDYAFSFVLGIFCMALALIAIVLLVVGIRKSSAYFLIPHLLMQFAMIVACTLVAGYLVLLMIGGTSIKINAVVYEDSPRGRAGLASINSRDPLRSTIPFRALNLILVLLLGLTVGFIGLQIWFFKLIANFFSVLRSQSAKTSFHG